MNGFDFGLNKNKSSKANVPAELQNKTVRASLELFEAQLEEQARKFQAQARQVARWDRAIYECIEQMQQFDQQIRTVENARKKLTQHVETLFRDQTEFLKSLPSVTSERAIDPNQRQKLYYLAYDLGVQLIGMENQLREIAERTESVSPKSESDAAKIEKIANCHFDAMRWLDNQATILQDRLDSISKKLTSMT